MIVALAAVVVAAAFLVWGAMNEEAARAPRITATWIELERHPAVLWAKGDAAGCRFETRYGEGGVRYAGDAWRIEFPWHPGTPELHFERQDAFGESPSVGSVAFRQEWAVRGRDARLAERAVTPGVESCVRQLKVPLKTGSVFTAEIGRIEPRHMVELLELAERIGRANLWSETLERYELRTAGPPMRFEGQVDGRPLEIRFDDRTIRIVIRADLGPPFALVHADHAPRKTVELNNPVLDLLLAGSGDAETLQRLTLGHEEELLDALHRRPGSRLSHEGLSLLLRGAPDDTQLATAIELAARVMRLLLTPS